MHWPPVLYPLSQFVSQDFGAPDLAPTYWYEGYCPEQRRLLRLPRTGLVEMIARQLMHHLAKQDQYNYEGKMYGVLLVETPDQQLGVLKAFSGLLHGNNEIEGWVPFISGREQISWVEAQTLARLEEIKQELLQLQALPIRQEYAALQQQWQAEWSQLSSTHRQQQQVRQQERQQLSATLPEPELSLALEALNRQSQFEGIARRRFKQARDAVLAPLQQQIEQADQQIRALKQERQTLSRQLQADMHRAYCLTNFAGQSRSLEQVVRGESLPTGAGDCCAPKLLHYAATHHLRPLAMAEFWWGPSQGDKVQGQFYGACAERCQPLMGFLLAGLPQRDPIAPQNLPQTPPQSPIPVIYQDEWLVVVNKPSGLLSVPGRTLDQQDSVVSRLSQQFPEFLRAVHRLDQDTSGLLVLALDAEVDRQLRAQFEHRQVRKTYEAILEGTVSVDRGVIDLPLWGNPQQRPYQQVDWQRGKPSLTQFRVLARTAQTTRIELLPQTGRTHQLRVHAADPQGLGVPIRGDRLYGQARDRLYLHARVLTLQHPVSGQVLDLQAETPF